MFRASIFAQHDHDKPTGGDVDVKRSQLHKGISRGDGSEDSRVDEIGLWYCINGDLATIFGCIELRRSRKSIRPRSYFPRVE